MFSSTRSLFGLLLVLLVLTVSSASFFFSSEVAAQSSLCPIQAFDIRFQPIDVEPRSFFTAAAQQRTVTRSRKFPRIIVRAVDSNGNLDPTVNNVVIVASSTAPATTIDSSTSRVKMYDGEAHFANLTILNGENLKLNFTAISDQLVRRFPNKTIQRYFLPLHNKYIETGDVTVLRQQQDVFALEFLSTSSFVRYPSMPFTVVPGVSFPAIRLQVITSAYTQYRPLLGLANNFSVYCEWASNPPAGTRLLNRLQPIVEGFATFDDLYVETTAKVLPPLIFRLAEETLSVRTGSITTDILRDNAHIAFETPDKSFVFTEGQEFSGQVDFKFPPILISVRNNMYQPASPRSGLIITASCGRAQLTGSVAGVVSGVASFDSLVFYGLNHEDFRPYVLTFTAGTQSGFSGESIYTGVVMMSVNSVPAYRFRWVPGATDSFFNGMFLKKQVVSDKILTPPLRIELLNSDNTRDTTSSGISVSIAAENSAFSSTSRILFFEQGVAQSLDFKFTKTSTIDDSFVVVSATSTVDPNARIVTGRINVTNAVSNFDLRFQPYGASLFSAEEQPSFATIGLPIPPIVIELITSANTLDTVNNEITITATSAGATLTGAFVRVTNGVAVFRELTYVSDVPGDFKITFTAGDAGSAPVGGKTIITGVVSLFAAVTPNVRPRFRNDSFIEFVGQSKPVSIDKPMQDFVVELATSDHTAAQVVNGTDASIVAEVSLSNGAFSLGARQSNIAVKDGVVILRGYKIASGLDPIMSICFRSTVTGGTAPPADGHCIKTGPLRTTSVTPPPPIGYLQIYKPSSNLPLDNKVAKGQVLKIAIAIFDTMGIKSNARVQIGVEVEVTASVAIAGTSRKSYNTSTGLALFDDLVFNKDFSAGVTPSLTFTARAPLGQKTTAVSLLNILPISTALLSIQGANAQGTEGDVVAEILTDTISFDSASWLAAVAKRLNVETQRILPIRVYRGKSADPDESGISEDTVEKPPSWSGTRVDMRFLPPLSTSRDTRSSKDLATLFVNLEPSCKIGELKLRKSYLRADDQSCDWFIFDAQLTSVRSCIQSKKQPGYCECHVPLFTFMGMRCLGLPRLTSLCVNILISEQAANCPQKVIVDVCQKLLFPDAPRTAVAASGAAMFMCFLPLLYLYQSGFFHKINLPTKEQSRVQKAMFVAADEKDLL